MMNEGEKDAGENRKKQVGVASIFCQFKMYNQASGQDFRLFYGTKFIAGC
jgi:hypothetical protein